MFIRKVKSRNSTCFQIGYKRQRKFVLLKHVGCASTNTEIEALKLKAKKELVEIQRQLPLFFDALPPKAKQISWRITGYHQVFGCVYDSIGFPNNLLRDLVVTRIVYPKSKLATMEYLERNFSLKLAKDQIYRFLDKLDKSELTKIAFDFVSKRNKGISLVFYDVTTLYFESDKDDKLRAKGFSKDHKNDLPQILIGLFVDQDGYPFDFDFFKGNSFEGHTFQIAINNLIKKYHLSDLTVVADAGMLSTDNITYLESANLNYIVGARIKNLSQDLRNRILSQDYQKTTIQNIELEANRLLVEFSPKRAKKDKSSREKIIQKLEQKIITKKKLITKHKYLLCQKQTKVIGINWTKIQEEEKFDGLKGYLTNIGNNKIKPRDVIDQYHNLWQVERAFRISKSDLRERPIFHYSSKRIASHLLLCFCSLLVTKETERILKTADISIQKAIPILGKIGQGKTRLGNIEVDTESELDQETKTILELFRGH